MKRCVAIVLLIGMVSALAWIIACEKPNPSETPKTIKIGVDIPLTGPSAAHGKDLMGGLEMARDEILASLKPGDPKPQLLIEDNQSKSQGGVSALQKLIQTDAPPVVIGPVASSVMLAMIPVAEQNKVVLLSPAASSPEISGAGKFIFRISLLAPPQTAALAKYATEKLKAKTAAVLYINDDTGLSYKNAFAEDFTKLGGKIVLEDSFDKTATEFRTQLTKIKTQNADVTFIPGIPRAIGLILRQARELKVDTKFLGNYGAEGTDLLTNAGEAAEGFVYTSIPIDAEFSRKFEEKNGRHPTIGAPLGYDALKIVWHAITENGATSEDIRKGLSALKDFHGATGTTTILPNGDASKEVQLKTIKNSEFVGL